MMWQLRPARRRWSPPEQPAEEDSDRGLTADAPGPTGAQTTHSDRVVLLTGTEDETIIIST
jgi:hypothetical protein